MDCPKSIKDNLRFLIAEVSAQIGVLQDYLQQPSATLAKRVLDRAGYTHSLTMRIHNSSFDWISQSASETDAQLLRAAESIATHLDRCSERTREVVQQVGYIESTDLLKQQDYQTILEQLLGSIGRIEAAFLNRDSQQALAIGEIEQTLDQTFQKALKRYTRALSRTKETQDLVSLIFIAKSLERMGDEMLSISEAILSANMGQPFSADRFNQLSASVAKLDRLDSLDDLVVEQIAETKSGSGISGIASAERREEGFDAIYKDGKKRKLKEERQGVENWHEIYPGLAPKILSYHKRGQSAALLIEHLAGLTFEQILLHEPQKLLEETLHQLTSTLQSVWKETRRKKSLSANYMEQLSKRLHDVYAVHPEFRQPASLIGLMRFDSFDQLLSRAIDYEQSIEAPFTVYIHGDFNVDNIIYDPLEKRINFIDLHRSRYMDYVQDITVFMVSIYRLQVLNKELRARMLGLAYEFCRFARKFARKMDDESFEIRLALGLARSFATSTRFILDKSLSRAMFLRARYLIEQVLETENGSKSFQTPVKELFVG